jgi:hypothetical protein
MFYPKKQKIKGGRPYGKKIPQDVKKSKWKFKRVKGYREIPKLIAALQQKNLDPVRNGIFNARG